MLSMILYDNNSYDNVQVPCHDHLEILGVVDVKMLNGAYITKVHIETL
jgi:hypothetical protein